MIKNLILALCLSFAGSAFAGECVDDKGVDIYNQPEVFSRLIETSSSCYEASALANACAWGSSLDVMTAGLAYNVCQKELDAQKPDAKILSLLGTMEQTCTDKYEHEEGTMYMSMNAYCHLSALEWILGLATPN